MSDSGGRKHDHVEWHRSMCISNMCLSSLLRAPLENECPPELHYHPHTLKLSTPSEILRTIEASEEAFVSSHVFD